VHLSGYVAHLSGYIVRLLETGEYVQQIVQMSRARLHFLLHPFSCSFLSLPLSLSSSFQCHSSFFLPDIAGMGFD